MRQRLSRPRLDGSQWNFEGLRDIALGQPTEVRQLQRLPLVSGERGECSAHTFVKFAMDTRGSSTIQ